MTEGPSGPRELIWMVDSLEVVSGFPPSVRQQIGFALYQAQLGKHHVSAKMLHGLGEKVWQVRADGLGGTYRAIYAVELGSAIYVLHAFQKKSTSGIETTKRELDRIRQRVKMARQLAQTKEGLA